MLAARCVIVSSSSLMERSGVKPREMIARVWVCSGGSWLIRITRCISIILAGHLVGEADDRAVLGVDESLLFFEIAETSSWRVTAQ